MNRSAKSNVRRLALARLISITGGAAAYTALMFTIWDETHSPAWQAAALLVSFGASGFLAPLGGALGDRFDRRWVMIWSDLLGAAAFAAMAFAHDPTWLLVWAFVTAVAETPFWSASAAAIPNLVPEEDLAWANGLIAVGKNIGVTIGPAVGGLLVASIGAPWVFGLNGLSFVVSAALVVTVRGRFSGDRSDAQEHSGVRAGFVFIARDRVLRTMTLAWVVFVLGIGVAMVADVPLAEAFDAGAIGFGLMIALWGAGSVAGSLAGRRLTERTEPKWLVVGTCIIAATNLAIALSPWFVPILVLGFGAGLGDAVIMVAEQGIRQRRTPDAVRSRAMAAADAVITLAYAISLALAGLVLHAIGPRGAYAVTGLAAAGAVAVLFPLIRVLQPAEAAPAVREIEPVADVG